jgi:A/G-specific adenine glycosylase
MLLWAEDAQGRVLLQRRPPSGIWAGLWSLPDQPDHAGARHWFDAHLRGDYDHAEPLPAVPHGFTHYRLTLHPLRWRDVEARNAVRDNPDLRWVERAQLAALGLPAPIRKLLASADSP